MYAYHWTNKHNKQAIHVNRSKEEIACYSSLTRHRWKFTSRFDHPRIFHPVFRDFGKSLLSLVSTAQGYSIRANETSVKMYDLSFHIAREISSEFTGHRWKLTVSCFNYPGVFHPIYGTWIKVLFLMFQQTQKDFVGVYGTWVKVCMLSLVSTTQGSFIRVDGTWVKVCMLSLASTTQGSFIRVDGT